MGCSPGPETTVDCDIQKGPCEKAVGDARITLDIGPRPVAAMRELVFSVRLDGFGSRPDEIVLSLTMPGMQMGENNIKLKKNAQGVYQAAGVIVRCPSGKTVWRADLLNLNAGFTFNVIDRIK